MVWPPSRPGSIVSTSLPAQLDPLSTLRQYAALAPWSLRDLASLTGAILDASAIYPVNAAARPLPSERTIRFYVGRKLVSPPEGRGTAATYGYRHLLQVLAIKLQQMEGRTLETLGREFESLPGDLLERRVAAALGTRLLPPAQLQLAAQPGTPRGKVGRALRAWAAVDPPAPRAPSPPARLPICRRIRLGHGLELLVDEGHPLFGSEHDGPVTELFERFLLQLRDHTLSPRDA